MFHLKNGGYLAIMFSSFLMKFFLLPTERNNKIQKSKNFDRLVCSVSANVLVVCWPTRWLCVGRCGGSVLVVCQLGLRAENFVFTLFEAWWSCEAK